jgi:hypothetical protein
MSKELMERHEDGTKALQDTPQSQHIKMKKPRENMNHYIKLSNQQGPLIKIHFNPFPVDDSIPSEEEICNALKRMKRGKALGGSGIK